MITELPMSESEREKYLALYRKRVAALFEIDRAGLLEDFLRDILHIRTSAMYSGNALNMSVLFELCAWYRKIAPYALSNGETLDFTRAEIEAYFGEPVDWNWFCGLDKKQKALAPIYFFRNYADNGD